MSRRTAVVWHRADLRVHDHPAIAAARKADRMVGLVVLDPRILDATRPRRVAWFLANVETLRDRYASLGGTLVARSGRPEEVVPSFIDEVEASVVHALASYTPYGVYRDRRTASRAKAPIRCHPGCYVHEPGSIVKQDGTPYAVFTPFYRATQRAARPAPIPPPRSLPRAPPKLIEDPLPRVATKVGLPAPGETNARAALTRFLGRRLDDYHRARDQLAVDRTSDVSTYLAVGALSPRLAHDQARGSGAASGTWIRQLAWRDFLADLLWNHPRMVREPLDSRWKRMPWTRDRRRFRAWSQGKTGIPLVDAGMRQLKATGRMHNRVRMVCAQFCAKHLGLPWTWGEQHFKHHLLDGDTAQNVGNWQWSAGLGVDAAPYFRVFNPVRQAKRFDPEGVYLRRWAPESGGDPRPTSNAIVDLGEAREAYLVRARRTLRAAR